MERVKPEYSQVRERLEGPSPGTAKLKSSNTIGYVLPFCVFALCLVINPYIPVPQPVRFLTVLTVLVLFSRGLLAARPSRFAASVAIGAVIFLVWIAPDVLIPGYRHFFLFSNPIVGHPEGSTVPADKSNFVFLVFRVLGSVLIIPIIEELFWRGWMMRWLIDRNFTRVPMGTYHWEAFWIVAVLFASEHGSFWDVGLVTGIILNWWVGRTKNLTDCVIAHAVANACLAAYVIGWNQWQYWL